MKLSGAGGQGRPWQRHETGEGAEDVANGDGVSIASCTAARGSEIASRVGHDTRRTTFDTPGRCSG